MSLTMHTAKQGDIPFQFLRYFSTFEEFTQVLSANRTGYFEGLAFTEPQTGELCVITPRYLRDFSYYSVCYLTSDYWQNTERDIEQPVVRGSRAAPVLKLILSYCEPIIESVNQTVLLPDFSALSANQKAHTLINALGLYLENEFELLSGDAVVLAVAILVVLFPCLGKTTDKTQRNLRAQLSPSLPA